MCVHPAATGPCTFVVWMSAPHRRSYSEPSFSQDLEIEALKSTKLFVFSRFQKHFNSLDTPTQLMDISSYEMNAKSMPTVNRLREYSLSVLQVILFQQETTTRN